MKKSIITILITTTLLLMVSFVLNGCKSKIKDSYLSIKMINNYSIGDENRRINQVLYFNRDNIYNNADIVSSIYLVDDNNSTLKLNVNDIRKTGYTHKFNNKKYYSYIYDLTIPSVTGDLVFENAKLLINSEENKIKIPIGIVSIKYDENFNDKKITVNSLSGLCAYSPYQSLNKIDIKLQNKDNNIINISKMNMGKFVDLIEEESDSLIFNNENINIDENIIGYMEKEFNLSLSYKDKYVLKESYVEIEYIINSNVKKEIVDTFNFYDNGYQLPIDSNLIYQAEFKI